MGSERLPDHKSVLAAASSYFENLLFNGMKESRQEVELAQFTPRTWCAAFEFIYGAEVDISAATIPDMFELLECAKYYQLNVLEKNMKEGIKFCADKSNFCELFMVAQRLSICQLKENVLQFVDKEFVFLCESHALDALDAKTMEEMSILDLPSWSVLERLE